MAGSYAIGIIGATGQAETKGHEQEGSTTGSDNERNSTTIKEGLLYGSIFAEYTFGEMYGLTLGVSYMPFQDAILGSGSRSDTGSGKAGASNDNGTYTAKASVTDHTTIYVEPTFMANENFGLYLKGGLARVNVNSLEAIGFGEDSSAYGDETADGVMLGLGIKGLYV